MASESKPHKKQKHKNYMVPSRNDLWYNPFKPTRLRHIVLLNMIQIDFVLNTNKKVKESSDSKGVI